MKILLGGVPFGCNNVGDEAILECAVGILRKTCPESEITVSTRDEHNTAAKLKVQACELFGFDHPYSRDHMLRVLQEHDVLIWCGATGLSDYPEIPLEMLRLAKRAGRKTVLWGVGMNSELNPAKYKVLPGKRRAILSGIQFLSLGLFDAVAFEEKRRERNVRRQIATELKTVDLVVVRDHETRAELLKCGVTREVIVGADSALLLKATPLSQIKLASGIRDFLGTPGKKIGVCISTAAPQFRDLTGLVDWLDGLTSTEGVKILFLPMDPVTDLALMTRIRSKMRHGENSTILEGQFEPAEILGILPSLDVVVTSRLHLLILSSIAAVPFVGISCGSKVDNFLHQNGVQAAGTVSDCRFDKLQAETLRLLQQKEACAIQLLSARQVMLQRLDNATLRLKQTLASGEFNPPLTVSPKSNSRA